MSLHSQPLHLHSDIACIGFQTCGQLLSHVHSTDLHKSLPHIPGPNIFTPSNIHVITTQLPPKARRARRMMKLRGSGTLVILPCHHAATPEKHSCLVRSDVQTSGNPMPEVGSTRISSHSTPLSCDRFCRSFVLGVVQLFLVL